MLLKVFAIYDSKVEAYMSPIFVPSRGQALRSFIDAAQDTTNNLGKHPADFTLFEIGVFDDSNATFDCHISPISLGNALELLSTTA
ncbi:MAG: nonstructural protein [Microviridae sp.]|nr:MAG: nonstructural protein [Microviridae sp.]